MKRGGNSVRRGIAALAAALLAAAALPTAAAAAPEEYDLAFPGAGSGQSQSGSGGGGGETTAPSVAPAAPATPATPAAPAVTDQTTTDDAVAGTGRQRNRDRDREQQPAAPVLASSGVNATAGPQEIPPLQLATEENGVPTLALVLAFLAAASCILALWRLRFLRELPAAPRRRAPRPEASS